LDAFVQRGECALVDGHDGARYRLRGRSKVVVTGATTGASFPAANETNVTHGQ